MSAALTRSQLDAMRAEQRRKRAENDSLSWCVHCGEGITFFCRSKCANRTCPRGMPFLPSTPSPLVGADGEGTQLSRTP